MRLLKDLRTKFWRYHSRKITGAIIICSIMYFIISIVITKGTVSSEDVQGAYGKAFRGDGGLDKREEGVVKSDPRHNRKNSSRKINRIVHNPLPGEGIKGLAEGKHIKDKNQGGEDEFSSSSTSSSADNPQQSEQKGNKLKKRLPQAIIIGVKKGGTRALLDFISLHPDVEPAKQEVHFFDRYYEKGLDWYREQMPLTKAGQITIEKTPSYFHTEEVPKRLYELRKDIKLIVVLRDPVVRAISDFAQSIATGRRKVEDFDRLAVPDPKTGEVDGEWYAVQVSTYDTHLSRWLKYFPRSQFVFINGDELIHNPASQVIKLQKFLKIDTLINEENFVFNATKGFYCVKKPSGMEEVEGEGTKCLGESKGRAHPSFSASVLQNMRNFFKPHNERLYSMMGENFHWEEEDDRRRRR